MSASDFPPFVLLGNPENRRATFFQEALLRCGFPPATVVSWERFLEDPSALSDALGERPVTLRIDSPGESTRVMKMLLADGADHPRATLSREEALHTELTRGRIFHPLQRFLGWSRALERIGAILDTRPLARVMNHPTDVLAMFDKEQTYARFIEHGVNTPERLGAVTCYDALREEMRRVGTTRVFIKLRHGSSASGVVAYRASEDRELAITSTKMVRDPSGDGVALYNSLRIQRYTDTNDVRDVIDALATQDVVVERWLPKATIDSRAFDLRIVVIDGEASHAVARSSATPMTNLHLGNRRVTIARVREACGDDAVEVALDAAARCAAAFPDTFYYGADVMLSSAGKMASVIEVNAFGDLLPNLLVNEQDTYTAEVAAWAHAMSTRHNG